MPFFKRKVSDSTSEFSLLAKIGNGAIADVISITCLFPLDLIKTRLQVQRIGPNGERMYKNLFDCLRKIYQTEGFTGMYKGLLVALCSITPDMAVNDYCRHNFKTKDDKLPFYRQFIAGGVAGLIQVTLSTPTELLKIQMQEAGVFAEEAKKAGKIIPKTTARKIASTLFRERGFFGLYKGFSVTMLRDVSFATCVFPLCATLNEIMLSILYKKYNKYHNIDENWITFGAALISAAVGSFIVTPFDVVKTRLQAQTLHENQDVVFTSTLDCLRKTIKNEGIVALFKGGFIRMLVMAPNFGIAKIIYDMNATEKLLYRIKSK